MNIIPGDFSFMEEHVFIFEYDYKIINSIGQIAWNKLKDIDNYHNNYVMEIIKSQLYPSHTELTYKLSIDNLIYIAKHGWDKFVDRYKGLKI
jgi:hypothetical protein